MMFSIGLALLADFLCFALTQNSGYNVLYPLILSGWIGLAVFMLAYGLLLQCAAILLEVIRG